MSEAKICHRSGHKVYAADRPVVVGGLTFHPAYFTCAASNTKLTLKTVVIKDGEAYHRNHVPLDIPTQVVDVTMQSQLDVPDASHESTLELQKSTADHSYGAGAVAVEGALKAPKPASSVGNVNNMEVRHQGVAKFG